MHHALLSISSAVFLAAPHASSDQPRFAVEEKATLDKTFERSMKLDSKLFRVTIEGRDDPMPGTSDVRISIDDTSHLEVTDEYLAMGKGRPERLRRTFDKIREGEHQKFRAPGHGEDGDANHERTEESELEGKSVLFTWKDESGGFDASFPEGKGDAELLEDLTEDMDFRYLLPNAEVSIEESWDLEPEAFGSLLAPGGDLKLVSKGEGGSDSNLKLGKEVRKHLRGKAHATWKGVREEEGKPLGILDLSADLTSQGQLASEGESSKRTRFEVKMELEGRLLWDLAEGHFHSFEASAKSDLRVETSTAVKMAGKSAEMLQEIEFEGDFSFRASAK